MIDLRQFRQFVALAEELSFRRAAARLNMAQPPLTAALRKLEAELGAVLIQRTNRVEGLTAAGEVFLVEARRALAQAERAIQSAKRASQGLKGSLRIAFVASAAHDVLPQTLRAFRQRHSDVELVLEEATTAQQIAALRQDRADIGFVVPTFARRRGSSRRHYSQRPLAGGDSGGTPAGRTTKSVARRHGIRIVDSVSCPSRT